MDVFPIQVTEEGVFIPKTYLREADEVEVLITDEYVLVKPKIPVTTTAARSPRKPHRFAFIASGRTRNPRASCGSRRNSGA